MAGRRRSDASAPADFSTRREPEADDHSGQDDHNTAAEEARAGDAEDEAEDQDQGEHAPGDAEDEDAAADFAARSNVDHDAEDQSHAQAAPAAAREGDGSGDGIALGDGSLTDRQRVGLDPVDPERHVREASDRSGLNNGQTAHEAANALDPVSGTPNPGVTETVRHSAPGRLGASDMSGRPAMPDPFAGLDRPSRDVMAKLRKASQDAHARGRPAGQGWLDLRQLGVHKAVMDALVHSGAVEQNTRPGGEFSPETGTVYRVTDHDRSADSAA